MPRWFDCASQRACWADEEGSATSAEGCLAFLGGWVACCGGDRAGPKGGPPGARRVVWHAGAVPARYGGPSQSKKNKEPLAMGERPFIVAMFSTRGGPWQLHR